MFRNGSGGRQGRQTGRRRGALAPPTLESGGGGAATPQFFADGIFFYMRTPGTPNQKSQADADMQPITNLI